MSTDPKRLADYGAGLRGVVRDALDAERAGDDGEAARLARIEAKLLAALGAAPVLATPPSPPAPAAPPPAPAPPAPAPSSWLGPKGAITLGAAALVVGAAFFLSRPAPTTSPSVQPTAPSVIQTAPPAAVDPAPVPPTIKTVSPSDLPTAVEPAAKPAPSAPAQGASTSATDTEEIALLARAHDALRGSPAESLELCRQHEKKFANGHFSQEREAVAIEALVYLGRRDEAEKRWSSFRTRFPGSSHRVHLESLFAPSPTNSAPPAR